MNRSRLTKLLAILAMLMSIAGGPAVASTSGCAASGKVHAQMSCCKQMACCAAREKQPAPVQQRVGQDLSAAVTAAPFSLLFTFEPTEPKRAPRSSIANGHAPEPLAASCIRLI